MPDVTISSGLSYSLPQTSQLFIFFLSPTLPFRLNHLIVFGLFDALLDQFLGEGLFIRSGHRGRSMTRRFAHGLPSVFLRDGFSHGRRRIQSLLAGQFPARLLQVAVQHLAFRPAGNPRQLARPLPHHLLCHRPQTVPVFGESSLLNSILFHALFSRSKPLSPPAIERTPQGGRGERESVERAYLSDALLTL